MSNISCLSVREIIDKFGLTQKAFSARFGIPLRTVQHWVAGTRQCPAYVRGMILEILESQPRSDVSI